MRYLIFAIFIILLTGCKSPVSYGYDPQGNRAYWDTQPTQIITWSPGDGEHRVSVTAPIRFTFSRAVSRVSEKNIRVHLMRGYYYHAPYVLKKEEDGRTYSILSRYPREYGTHYAVEIFGVYDAEGNEIPRKQFIFQTEHQPSFRGW